MNATILHESRGRIRFQLRQNQMTLAQADLLETWLQRRSWCRQVTVHERTCCVILYYDGTRQTVLNEIRHFSWQEAERTTALPLPLGGIAAKRSLPEAVRRQVETLIRQSIEYAFAHPEASRAYIKEHAQELDDAVIDAHIALFVNDYSLSLGDEGRRAVEALTGIACAFNS